MRGRDHEHVRSLGGGQLRQPMRGGCKKPMPVSRNGRNVILPLYPPA